MCDIAYVLQVEALERRVLAAQYVSAVFASAGADTEIPDVDVIRGQFDAALESLPVPLTGRELLQREMGVA